MIGLTKKYEEQLHNMPKPIFLENMPNVDIDYEGLIAYAKKKGVRPIDLTHKEKEMFVIDLNKVYDEQ